LIAAPGAVCYNASAAAGMVAVVALVLAFASHGGCAKTDGWWYLQRSLSKTGNVSLSRRLWEIQLRF